MQDHHIKLRRQPLDDFAKKIARLIQVLKGEPYPLPLILANSQTYIILIVQKEIRMFPAQCNIYSSFSMYPSVQNLFNAQIFQFGYPYYIPLSVFPQNQGAQTIQNHLQIKQIQNSLKHQSKITNLAKNESNNESKKKNMKIQKEEQKVLPFVKKENKNALDFGEQKEGRNANSNLLRMFFRRLEYRFDFQQEKLKKIWQKFAFTLTLDEFIDWVHEAKIDYRNYIRVPSVKKLFKMNSKHKEHNKILRVLLKDFLDREALCCYLTSRKIKKESMPYNFRSIRTIYEELFNEQVK